MILPIMPDITHNNWYCLVPFWPQTQPYWNEWVCKVYLGTHHPVMQGVTSRYVEMIVLDGLPPKPILQPGKTLEIARNHRPTPSLELPSAKRLVTGSQHITLVMSYFKPVGQAHLDGLLYGQLSAFDFSHCTAVDWNRDDSRVRECANHAILKGVGPFSRSSSTTVPPIIIIVLLSKKMLLCGPF